MEISFFSFLNLHSLTLNFGFYKYLCFFRKCFVQWVLRWFCFSSQGGLRDIAKSLGLGESIEIRLCRQQKESSGTSVFGIKTDFLVNIGMPTILSGKDKLQGITPSSFFYLPHPFWFLQKEIYENTKTYKVLINFLPLTQSSSMLVNRNKHFLKWGNKTQNRNFAAVTKLFCNILKFQILPLIRILLVQVLNSKIQCLWEKFFIKLILWLMFP